MAFDPLGYGDRWYDRLISGKPKPKEFAVVLLIVVALSIILQLS